MIMVSNPHAMNDSHNKSKRKQFFLKAGLGALSVLVLVVAGLLFWAPWMGEDGGEETIRATTQSPEVRAELDTLTAKYSCSATDISGDCCDGMSSSWAPFGRQVKYCEYGTWYVPFWGN